MPTAAPSPTRLDEPWPSPMPSAVSRKRRGPHWLHPTRRERAEWRFAALLLSPAVVMLAVFVAYPFEQGIWLSLSNTLVGVPGKFVGVTNYTALWRDSIFRRAAFNTFIYTLSATILKLTLGVIVALLLNTLTRFKRFISAAILLPWIVPTVLSVLAWRWMFNPTFSVVNWSLARLGIIVAPIQWLGGPVEALISIVIVNVWRGTPFYAITLLAGLQTIEPDLHEAAALDGANSWQRFWHITWPLLMPVTSVVVLFSVIFTFADFQLIYVLTGGGPANTTQVFSVYAYQLAIQSGMLGKGAAASLAMFPFLLAIVIVQLWYVRRGAARTGGA